MYSHEAIKPDTFRNVPMTKLQGIRIVNRGLLFLRLAELDTHNGLINRA